MKANPVKHAMKYGLILGALFSVNFLMSASANTTIQFLSNLATAAIIYFTYKFTVHFRKTEQNNTMTYFQGVSYIIWLFLFAAIISSAVKYIYWQFINPEYLPNLMNQSLLMLETMKIEITDEMLEQVQRTLRPAVMALQFIWINILTGLFVALITAAFTRKEKSIFENEDTDIVQN